MRDRTDKKGFFRRRLTLGNAVILSLFLHLVFVIGSELSLPDFYTPPDEILDRKKPTVVQRVRITAAPKPPAPPPGPRFISSLTPSEKKPAAPAPDKKTEPLPRLPQESAADVTEDASTQADNAVAKPSEDAAPIPAPAEPAPAFPIQIRATLELRVNSLTASAEQRWVMEGLDYSITMNAKKFGFKAQLESEGEIGPDGGLLPRDYRMKINDRIRTFSEFRNGTLRYGKPSGIKSASLPAAPQDMISLPFHVAVTFNGSPQTIMVSSGKNLYEIRLVLDAEETLKLPVGTLRTLHLRGERFNPSDGTLLTGYEVWLAPDYLNYPVKFVGRTGNGDVVEYRVTQLEIEGKSVLGDPTDHVITPEGDDIPAWLKNRVDESGDDIPAPSLTTP
ncbi:MAG TPA: hypothetical protein DF427_10250 [Moraxellaceae bacterium]|nr:hypothetical protein [Moraxellaceae bacterium]